ncbi:MAG: hypothetical protein WBB28_06780 [Crinalium sp.]
MKSLALRDLYNDAFRAVNEARSLFCVKKSSLRFLRYLLQAFSRQSDHFPALG